MKKLITFIAVLLAFASCTFGNESTTGPVFVDYIPSLSIFAGVVISLFAGDKYLKSTKEIDSDEKASLFKTSIFILFIGAIFITFGVLTAIFA